jgi:hypothetical protein
MSESKKMIKVDERTTIRIVFDENQESPRTSMDNLGTIAEIPNHSYKLGDEILDIDSVRKILDSDEYIALPVYAYIHSGISLNTIGFSCPFDSGMCGVIYVSKDAVRNEYGELEDIVTKTVKNVLQGEVDTFSKYLNGECYGYIIERDGIEIDSCFGFHDEEYCISEAKQSLRLAV